MLSIIYSDWYYGVGKLYKQDGTPYRTAHGAFRKHPCTQWAAANQYNLAWLIRHGYALCHEYNLRYNKVHTCLDVIVQAERIYHKSFDNLMLSHASRKVADFTRAMPEYLKFDTTIDTITAYKRYLNTKPWLATNYLRIPSRKPAKATKTSPAKKRGGKAGRIVGISADENAYIQEVLIMIADDPELGQSNPNYVKIQARYNK
jgi:hypothetical protein